jgi:hypothetical protein
MSERGVQYLTSATGGPYVISITEAAATELPWEQLFADTPKPSPPLNREQRRRAQRKKR